MELSSVMRGTQKGWRMTKKEQGESSGVILVCLGNGRAPAVIVPKFPVFQKGRKSEVGFSKCKFHHEVGVRITSSNRGVDFCFQ